MKKSKSQEADKFLNLKIHPLHDSDPPPGSRGVWGYQEYQVSLQMCSYKSKLHCTMKSHITTFLYPTIPQLCHTLH